MQNSDNKIEILAPAGNEASLKAAVANGADAVYLGTKNFNARSKADNFSEEQLRLAVSYCHERGVRVYVTLNTLVKDTEIQSAINVVKTASDAGVDAFLIQDIGLYLILCDKFPEVSFHASTQMGIHNLPGAIMAEKLGFDRIVMSREVLPNDIRLIKCNTKLELEMFVHGAHCVSFSGNCYFSAMVSGYSGNRGKCLQLCRKKYELAGGGRRLFGYALSAKDICLLPDINKLSELGIDSFKIEGRLRSPEYAGTVTDVYKRAISGDSRADDHELLKIVFNRGNFSRAYVDNDKPDIIYPIQQNNIGVKIGVAVAADTVAFDKKYNRCDGDGYKVLRNGSEIGGAHFANGRVVFDCKAMKGDEICLTKSAAIEKEIARKTNNHKTKINNFAKNTRKNHSTMSDIVSKEYVFPDRCKILQTNEFCDVELTKQCNLIILSPDEYSIDIVKNFAKACNVPILLDMPVEARGTDVDLLEKIVKADLVSGYVANNIYALEMCKGRPIVLGMGMNSISNSLRYSKIMSPESAGTYGDAAVYAFGKLTLMNLTHCPKRQLGFFCKNCNRCSDELTMRDEMKNMFPLRKRKLTYCYWELLNGRILNLFPKLDKKIHGRIIVDVRNVSAEQARRALSEAYDLAFNDRLHTYGRFGKGVK